MNTASLILNWYKKNMRPLPWRSNIKSYNTWVAEIIMQQTRMEQGLPYYHRFIKKYPTVTALANTNEDDLLLMWQGLGYYSRARNMHITAKYIVNNKEGVFPETYEELIQLKGIGEYTAAAIASLSTNQKVAAIDGNVYRVITRLFDIEEAIDKSEGKKIVKALTQELLKEVDAKDFNQAIMDFGSQVCKPKQAHCQTCPLISTCMAYKNKTINQRPVKKSKTKVQKRILNYLIVKDDKYIYINKRDHSDIWKGLYEFIILENEKDLDVLMRKHQQTDGINTPPPKTALKIINAKAHKLSHQTIHTQFAVLHYKNIPIMEGYQKVKIKQLHNYAFPKLINNYLTELIEFQ